LPIWHFGEPIRLAPGAHFAVPQAPRPASWSASRFSDRSLPRRTTIGCTLDEAFAMRNEAIPGLRGP
jgi:hypothetical protein